MKRRGKYNNQKCSMHGHIFDSILERNRYVFLLSQQSAGNISDLRMQQEHEICVNDKKICTYISDFTYFLPREDAPLGRVKVVEDVKGVRTAVFNIKAKLLSVIYGIEIKIVKKENISTL